MILFSTMLDMNDTITPDSFIQLILEWNQGSPYPENIIPGIIWKGEHSIRYGTDRLWLEIQEYQKENIIAVRYEKTDTNEIVWSTDYIMNFNEMKMAIQLDRGYLEDIPDSSPAFSTPHFITMLIQKHYLKDDGQLPILREPVFIQKKDTDFLADIICGRAAFRLPIVYISKTAAEKDPVDIWRLAGLLKGVAHVLVEENLQLNSIIRQKCDDKNEFHGAVGIYYPGSGLLHKRYMYHAFQGFDEILFENVRYNVIQYSNIQKISPLYTWQGVNNALLRDRLNSRSQELAEAKDAGLKAKEEADELIELVDADLNELKRKIDALTKQNESLTCENQGLRQKMKKNDQIPILYLGEENEFFEDEIKAIILEALEDKRNEFPSDSRRKTILDDIIKNNPCRHNAQEWKEEIIQILRGYKTMNPDIRRSLQKMGFTITEDGKHYKLVFHRDDRYQITLAKSASDYRAGLNTGKHIDKYIL